MKQPNYYVPSPDGPQSKPKVQSLRERFERARLEQDPATGELPSMPHGRLTDQLLQRGLLTPAMVRQLKAELSETPDDKTQKEMDDKTKKS